jgi:alpha-aminoadipate carrier protein LysW
LHAPDTRPRYTIAVPTAAYNTADGETQVEKSNSEVKGVTSMATAFCPNCDGEIRLGPQPRIGQRVTCPDCDTELEIIELDPPELDWIYEGPGEGKEEDW